MACRDCRNFIPQRTASDRIKHAAGRCVFMVEVPLVPIVIDVKRVEQVLTIRSAAWPDEGENCPTFEELA